MSTAAVTSARPILLTREGTVFRLAFDWDRNILARVKELPYATFDPVTKTWTTLVCGQSVQMLRRAFYEGLTDVAVDQLLAAGEDPAPCARARVRAGTAKRPYYVHFAMRGDSVFTRVRSIPGAQWVKAAGALSFPAQSALALAELVDRGVLDDPQKLLTPADTVVAFDARTGGFVVRGPDTRAAAAFDKHFPERDVVAAWQERGLDVAFADEVSEQIYRGELARSGDGFQPEGFGVQLYPFQARNLAVALERTGFGIFDAPGLGKTAQATAAGFELLRRGQVTRTIVIAPAAVRTQWAAEIARFTGVKDADIVVVAGDKKRRERAYEAGLHAQWVVVHYDVLSRDLKALKPLFDGALVVADEAHRLKTYNSARTEAALELCQGAARRIGLTGTPSERDPGEWFQVLWFIQPGCLGSPKEFNDRYRYKSNFGYEGARNIPELRERSRVYYGRHTKAQVATHLPPLRVQQVLLDPDPKYAAALTRAHREAAAEIHEAAKERLELGHAGQTLREQDEADEVRTGAEMTAVGMLRLMCSSPRLVAGSEATAATVMLEAGIVPDEDGPKLDELRVMMAELKAVQERRLADMAEQGIADATPAMVQGERVVVFTFSRKMAELISERLEADGVKHVTYTGSTNRADRDAAVSAFTDPNSDVIAFVATDAAAEGLNLGRCCSTLVQFDLAWTPARAIQRMNRIHRLDGTASSYLVINLVIANTIEIGISKLLGDRADLSDALFGEKGSRYQATGKHGRRGGSSVFEEAMDIFTPETDERTGRVKTQARQTRPSTPAGTTTGAAATAGASTPAPARASASARSTTVSAPAPRAAKRTAPRRASTPPLTAPGPDGWVPPLLEPPVDDDEAPFPDGWTPAPSGGGDAGPDEASYGPGDLPFEDGMLPLSL